MLFVAAIKCSTLMHVLLLFQIENVHLNSLNFSYNLLT
jgi:hypothetical protein